jgi:hypothetical protein
MNSWKHFTQAIAVLAGWFALCAQVGGQTTSRLSTTFLARGEQALLEVSVAGGEPDDVPEISAVDKIAIQPTGRGPLPRMLGRRVEYVYNYIVTGYEDRDGAAGVRNLQSG